MGKFLLELELYIILALTASEKHGELIHIHSGTEKILGLNQRPGLYPAYI